MAAQFTTRWSAAIVRVENSTECIHCVPRGSEHHCSYIQCHGHQSSTLYSTHSSALLTPYGCSSVRHFTVRLAMTVPAFWQLSQGYPVSSIEPLRAVAMQVHAYHIIPLCSMPSSSDKYFVSATSAMLFGEASIQTDVQHYDINFKNIDSVLTIYRGERWHIERFRIWGVPPMRCIWLDEL